MGKTIFLVLLLILGVSSLVVFAQVDKRDDRGNGGYDGPLDSPWDTSGGGDNDSYTSPGCRCGVCDSRPVQRRGLFGSFTGRTGRANPTGISIYPPRPLKPACDFGILPLALGDGSITCPGGRIFGKNGLCVWPGCSGEVFPTPIPIPRR